MNDQDSISGWIELVSYDDIQEILEQYGSFHDACLRDFHLSTSAHVAHDLSMVLNNQITAVLLFQRQSKTNPVLEFKFLDVVGFNYQPPAINYNEVIYDVFFKIEDGIFYWADHKEWTLGGFQSGDVESIWIGARTLYYRWRPKLLGNIVRFPE